MIDNANTASDVAGLLKALGDAMYYHGIEEELPEEKAVADRLKALEAFVDKVGGVFNPARLDNDYDGSNAMGTLWGLSQEARELTKATAPTASPATGENGERG